MRKIHKARVFRVVSFAFSILIQLAVLISVIIWFNRYFAIFYGISILISIVAVIWILNDKINPAYKISWIILIILFPIFGGLFYLLYGGNRMKKKEKAKMEPIRKKTMENLKDDSSVLEMIRQQSDDIANQSRYIKKFSNYPPYRNEYAEYFPSGEGKFKKLKDELRKAERFIFLEYFIIEEGVMWDSILKILIDKANKGVDVRVIYDDAGCMTTLPYGYNRRLEKLGIQCCVFNPMIPVISAKLNHRDHRKICIIDGHTGFTGGINLADEYINEYEKHGHWKDAAIMIKGQAVWSLTVMFLAVWDYIKGVTEEEERYHSSCGADADRLYDGYVQPFADSPLDQESVGEGVYLNFINKAKRYVYIMTPYLIIDNEMITALCMAAKSGVDVRIITPYHFDKWFVHSVSRSYYNTLIESGVRIYEYLPGFIHSKICVADDEYGFVGTINMDYRSLYLHFECGIWLYRCSCLHDIKKDFLETIEISQEITAEVQKNISWVTTMVRSILRIFSPLM
ncbi:MAG: cardiolipin synthase [Desulfitobacteriaceae bacterium]|nr:cardiolipin synthase [Desulfitobacteriaceae bacterium]